MANIAQSLIGALERISFANPVGESTPALPLLNIL